jgi:hypothetical protein
MKRLALLLLWCGCRGIEVIPLMIDSANNAACTASSCARGAHCDFASGRCIKNERDPRRPSDCKGSGMVCD